MKSLMFRLMLLAGVILLCGSAQSAFAQRTEFNPYVGFQWPSTSAAGHLRDDASYGFRVGYFLDANVELEGQVGYIPHFKVDGVDNRSRGILWNAGTSYNFSTSDFPFTRKLAPFVIADVGGITMRTQGYTYSIPGSIPLAGGGNIATVRTVAVRNSDTFFNVSYGVGVKSIGMWGPLGVRAEVRGRTIPNYYHGAPTWVEATVGLNFVFGEPRPY